MKFGVGGILNKSFLTFFLVACLSFAVLNMGVVSATHDAIVTIDPNIANCEQLGNTFTVNIENDDTVANADDIFEVRIYSGTYGIADFSCGPAPTGWTLWDFTSQYGYCEYKTAWDGTYVIVPGDDLDFTFDATMEYTQECYSQFLVSTLDNKRPEGEHEYNWPQVDIDCTPPEIDKSLKYGTGIGVCPPSVQGPNDECWIRQSTCVEFDASDSTDDDPCNLGLAYCEYSYTVDGSPHTGPIRVYPNDLPKEICFGEDSLHVLNITCYDVAGNVKEDIEKFRVDDTPPVTTKFVSDPKKIEPIPGSPYFIEWVDSVTEITLNYVDPDPTGNNCNIGVDKTWYRNDWWLDGEGTAGCYEPANYCNFGWYSMIVSPYIQHGECIDMCQEECSDLPSPAWEECVELCAHDYCGVDTAWKLYKGEPITKDEESCHVLTYFSVDHLGNIEDMNMNCFFVDKTAPIPNKIVGDPYVPCREAECNEFEYWVKDEHYDSWGSLVEGTPITMECTDPEPHPSGDEEVCYRVSFDLEPYDLTDQYCDEPLEEITQEGHEGFWCCVDPPKEIIFVEDSLHDLEFFCRDAVDKKSEIDIEWFRVDSQPPIIYKEMIGEDHLGYRNGELNEEACPPRDWYDDPYAYEDECYVRDDGLNGVAISVWDDPTYDCAVDAVECYKYMIWYAPSPEACGEAGGVILLETSDIMESFPTVENSIKPLNGVPCLLMDDFFTESQEVIFTQDSFHELYIVCWDALYNFEYDYEIFYVDSTPPEIWKEYDWPYKVEPGCYEECEIGCQGDPECIEECIHFLCTWWINSSTPITITAEDEKVGVDKIYWANNLVPDEACWYPAKYCFPVETSYNEVEGNTTTFYKTEESCHLIQYYAVDKLGNGENEEDLKWQCVFVDNTGPEAYKEVGDPKEEAPGSLADWYVTKNTEIELWCDDSWEGTVPHPVNQDTLYWRFSTYTDEFISPPTYDPPSDWYSADYTQLPIMVNFPEDCWHDLEYYCVDHLGNVGPLHVQYYIVDTEPPVIEKTIVGPKWGDCPPEEEGDVCFIDGETEIHIDVTDPEPHPVDMVECQYMIYWLASESECTGAGGVWQGEWCYLQGVGFGDHAIVTFSEESKHKLVVDCWDALGNQVSDEEIFYVDKTPPGIWKQYGSPYYYYENDYWAEWINHETTIYAGVTDDGPHKSGIKEVHYRTTRVNDEYCRHYFGEDDYECEDATGDGLWMTVAPEDFDGFEFTIDEDSCHLIEIHAMDNVDKEKLHKQCVFVDNQAPVPNKTVGEPKAVWDGQDSLFYPWIAEKCWSEDPEEMIECWKVTMKTPISLVCVDPEPHPVDHEIVCFNVELDGTDATEDYCGFDGEMQDNGFCCLDHPMREFNFREETEHNLKYYCVDALGNSNEEDVDEEKFKVEGTVFEIPLYKKWNLISVPFVLLDSTPEEVFKDTPGVEAVWTYDGETDEWYVWGPGPMTNNLNSIDPGWGYWVLEMEDTDDECALGCVEGDVNCLGKCGASEWLTLGGSLFSPRTLPPSRNLVKGWNLIGYYGTSWELYPFGDQDFVCGDAFNPFDRFIYGDKAYCSLNSLVDTQEGYPRWSSLWSYIRCPILDDLGIPYIDLDGIWMGINTCADQDSPLQMALSRMYAGRGYWLEMDVEDQYAPATTCIWNDDFECRWTGGGILP